MPSDDLRRRAVQAVHSYDCSPSCTSEHTPEVWPEYEALAAAVLAAVAGTLPNTTAEIRLWLSAHDLPMTHGVGRVFDAIRADLETK